MTYKTLDQQYSEWRDAYDILIASSKFLQRAEYVEKQGGRGRLETALRLIDRYAALYHEMEFIRQRFIDIMPGRLASKTWEDIWERTRELVRNEESKKTTTPPSPESTGQLCDDAERKAAHDRNVAAATRIVRAIRRFEAETGKKVTSEESQAFVGYLFAQHTIITREPLIVVFKDFWANKELWIDFINKHHPVQAYYNYEQLSKTVTESTRSETHDTITAKTQAFEQVRIHPKDTNS